MLENSYDSAVVTSCVSGYNKISVRENVLQLWSNILMAFCWNVERKENTVFLFSIINTLIWDFRFSLLVSGSIWIVILPGNFILVLNFPKNGWILGFWIFLSSFKHLLSQYYLYYYPIFFILQSWGESTHWIKAWVVN